MKHGYKHLRAEDAHYLEAGSFLLRSLSGLREAELGKSSDNKEGRIESLTRKHLFQKGYTPPMLAENIRPNFNLSPDSVAIFENCTFLRERDDCWTYCISTSLTGDCFSDYDATFRIRNLATFARTIQAAAPTKLGPPTVAKVLYRDGYDLGSEKLVASPFIKRTVFADEQEIRIVWPMIGQANPALTVNAQEGKRFLQRLPSR